MEKLDGNASMCWVLEFRSMHGVSLGGDWRLGFCLNGKWDSFSHICKLETRSTWSKVMWRHKRVAPWLLCDCGITQRHLPMLWLCLHQTLIQVSRWTSRHLCSWTRPRKFDMQCMSARLYAAWSRVRSVWSWSRTLFVAHTTCFYDGSFAWNPVVLIIHFFCWCWALC